MDSALQVRRFGCGPLLVRLEMIMDRKSLPCQKKFDASKVLPPIFELLQDLLKDEQ